jgi:hypothetical protein
LRARTLTSANGSPLSKHSAQAPASDLSLEIALRSRSREHELARGLAGAHVVRTGEEVVARERELLLLALHRERELALGFVEQSLFEVVGEDVAVARAGLPSEAFESRAQEARRDALLFAGRVAAAHLVARDEVQISLDVLELDGLERRQHARRNGLGGAQRRGDHRRQDERGDEERAEVCVHRGSWVGGDVRGPAPS